MQVNVVAIGRTIDSSQVSNGGFNGGGNGLAQGGGGGGASDIRLGTDSLFARVIVAGGGGGGYYSGNGGVGGGKEGKYSGYGSHYHRPASIYQGSYVNKDIIGCTGGFGLGGSAQVFNSNDTGGGGGGWYGGGAPSAGNNNRGEAPGSGGSGWVYTASNFNTWKSENPTDANKYLLSSSYYLNNAETKAGDTSFSSPTNNSNETGHSGNGYARITPVN